MAVVNSLVSIVVFVLVPTSDWTGTVVCTNLSESGAEVLCDSTSAAFPLGCDASIGHFGSLTSAEIERKVSEEGIPGLMTIWEGFGEAFTVGLGSGHAGCFEVEVRETRGAQVSGVLHVAVMNGPSPEASTSLILLAFEGQSAPSETAGGLSETLFLHLREVSVVIGMNDGHDAGVRALPVASTRFAVWVHDQLGSSEPSLLALSADGDGDDTSNLKKCALLGDPESGADEIGPDFVVLTETGELVGRYPALLDDSLLSYQVEVCNDLVEERWEALDSEVEVNEEALLPEGFHECRVPLPDVIRHFFRVRVAYGLVVNGGW